MIALEISDTNVSVHLLLCQYYAVTEINADHNKQTLHISIRNTAMEYFVDSNIIISIYLSIDKTYPICFLFIYLYTTQSIQNHRKIRSSTKDF